MFPVFELAAELRSLALCVGPRASAAHLFTVRPAGISLLRSSVSPASLVTSRHRRRLSRLEVSRKISGEGG
ncbi:hypothetical protein NDU88_003291 [Pleurodeles waltl]|uniref:Uncharacterized protein n=1 Tax=Pleurodeles waltl TaxID=8319 RepID=A0AAV7PGH4_PLEWA|nr:hypothetical protein NDU88_003291 [Pleurodeles waltl]